MIAQNQMKKMADLNRHELQFEVGDEVFLKLKLYHQCSLTKRNSEKLSPKFYGPYPITAKIGEVAYHLLLSKEVVIHNVFHVSQLKKMLGKKHMVQDHPPNLTKDFEL